MLPSSAGSGEEKSSGNRSPPPAGVTAGGAAAAAAAAASGARYVTAVGPNDVQLGRGRPVVTSEGNKRLRQLILSNRTGYTASGKHAHKDAIARQIVRTIQERGGNFLKKVESASERESLGLSGDDAAAAWVAVDEEASILKVKQALREQESSAKSETSPTPPRKRRKKADGDGVASASAADTADVASAVETGVPTHEEHRQQSHLESDLPSTQLARPTGQLKTTGEEDSEGASATAKSDGSSPDEAPKEATKLLMQLKHYTLGDGGVDNRAGTAWAGESPLSPPLQDANTAGTSLEEPSTAAVASTTSMSHTTPTIATAEDERQPTPPEASLLTLQPMNSAAAAESYGRIDPADSAAALGSDDVQQSHPSSAKATSADDAMDPDDAPIDPKDAE